MSPSTVPDPAAAMAWRDHVATPEYLGTKAMASDPLQTDLALWNAFYAGWLAAQPDTTETAPDLASRAHALAVAMLDLRIPLPALDLKRVADFEESAIQTAYGCERMRRQQETGEY